MPEKKKLIISILVLLLMIISAIIGYILFFNSPKTKTIDQDQTKRSSSVEFPYVPVIPKMLKNKLPKYIVINNKKVMLHIKDAKKILKYDEDSFGILSYFSIYKDDDGNKYTYRKSDGLFINYEDKYAFKNRTIDTKISDAQIKQKSDKIINDMIVFNNLNLNRITQNNRNNIVQLDAKKVTYSIVLQKYSTLESINIFFSPDGRVLEYNAPHIGLLGGKKVAPLSDDIIENFVKSKLKDRLSGIQKYEIQPGRIEIDMRNRLFYNFSVFITYKDGSAHGPSYSIPMDPPQ